MRGWSCMSFLQPETNSSTRHTVARAVGARPACHFQFKMRNSKCKIAFLRDPLCPLWFRFLSSTISQSGSHFRHLSRSQAFQEPERIVDIEFGIARQDGEKENVFAGEDEAWRVEDGV